MLIKKIIKLVESSSFFNLLLQNLQKKDQKNLYYNLPQSARALSAAFLFAKSSKSLLYISQDDKTAEDFMDDFILLCGRDKVRFFPDYEVLPYEKRSPHYTIRAQRIDAMSSACQDLPRIYSLSIRSFLRNIVPSDTFKKNVIELQKFSEYDIDELTNQLVAKGYKIEYHVLRSGEIARRGGILDVFVPGKALPFRLEFFGEELESIRPFNPNTQISLKEELASVVLLPAREFSLHDIDPGFDSFENIHRRSFYEGIEQDTAILLKNTENFVDYFNASETIIVFDSLHYLQDLVYSISEDTYELHKKHKLQNEKSNIPDPELIFRNEDYFRSSAKKYHSFFFSMSLCESGLINKKISGEFSSQKNYNGEVDIFKAELNELLENNYKVFIQTENESQQKRLKEILVEHGGRPNYELGVFQKGFRIDEAEIAFFTDHEIFNRFKRKKYHETQTKETAIIDYDDLTPGDYIVHIVHGIGIYEGLKKVTVAGNVIECLSILYTDNDRVYVPTYQLKLVTKYVAEEGVEPVIHKLGSKKWENQKNRARKDIELIADDILKLYAERMLRTGISCNSDHIWQEEMEDSFVFEDTLDQKKVTEEIKADMESPQPMERLLCGDVGFGKTEVAVRAAFKAVLNNYQVAVLVPTTLLAEQHYLVFKERLAPYPVNISMFSRFRSPSEIKSELVRLKKGEIDIAVGTHRLLSEDVKFCRLGLLIVDEEHRFGVRHKEKIRKFKTNIDTLYMSATPIPRTLNMTLAKLKEISLIQTSPKARIPIRTAIIGFDKDVIKDAIINEVERGGQVFFLHNRVESIESMAEELRGMLPGCRIEVGHGQLPEKKLEKIMLDFAYHKFDVLVATTIIESGLDIANANTILVNRADCFGLAQLYQIRGRVGRSNRRAYAYFIIPRNLSTIARKRLETLAEYNTLGSGYQIAMRDLELRGAGSLLGTKQSGVVTAIGFNFYNKLLQQAIENLREKNPRGIWEDEKDVLNEYNLFRIDVDYYFPESYVSDETTRLQLYKRMMSFSEKAEFDAFFMELKDRFGNVPKIVYNAVMQYKIRFLANLVKLDSFKFVNGKVTVLFNQKRLPSKKQLADLLSEFDYPVKFDVTDNKLKMIMQLTEADKAYSKMNTEEKYEVINKVNLLIESISSFYLHDQSDLKQEA